jgi:hypothetical protein
MTSPSRIDPFCFYACALPSFLESTVPTYVDNLEPFFRADKETLDWLRDTWLPEEAEHGRLLRAYVERVWPEFRWERAYAEFRGCYVPRCETGNLRPSVGLEALARCVTETEATMIYRCIGRYAADPELAALMKRLSSDEARHYSRFRRLHEKHQAGEKLGFLRRARALIARSELVREEDLALAFLPLNAAWASPPPFATCSYRQFLAAAGQVMRAHFPFEEAKRMLFHPLKGDSPSERLTVAIMAWIVSRQFLRHA